MTKLSDVVNAWNLDGLEPKQEVVLSIDVLERLFELAFGLKDFDEITYLKDNPDVAESVRRGDFLSGKQHYMRRGIVEDRPVIFRTFNEAAYLLRNTDVKREVDLGKFESGRVHWEEHGWLEGRVF